MRFLSQKNPQYYRCSMCMRYCYSTIKVKEKFRCLIVDVLLQVLQGVPLSLLFDKDVFFSFRTIKARNQSVRAACRFISGKSGRTICSNLQLLANACLFEMIQQQMHALEKKHCAVMYQGRSEGPVKEFTVLILVTIRQEKVFILH